MSKKMTEVTCKVKPSSYATTDNGQRTTDNGQTMTEVRTFRARTMQEALAVVRDEFGPEAVILHTRETAASRIWPWSRRAAEVEVTAGRDVMVASKSGSRRPQHVAVESGSASATGNGRKIGNAPDFPHADTPHNPQ